MPNYTDNPVNNLVINKMTQAKYNELANQGLINQNEIYAIEDANINASNKTIINVADPVNDNDAANKAYVDSHSGGGGGGSVEIVNFDDVVSGDDITSEMFNKLITPGTMIYRNNTIYTQIELYPLDTDEDGFSWGGATYACPEQLNHFSISIDGWNEEEWSTELFFDVTYSHGKYEAEIRTVLLPPVGTSGEIDTEYVEDLFATGRSAYSDYGGEGRLYTSAGGGYGSGMGPDKLVLISRDGTTEYRLEFHAEGTGDSKVWYVTPTPIVKEIATKDYVDGLIGNLETTLLSL